MRVEQAPVSSLRFKLKSRAIQTSWVRDSRNAVKELETNKLKGKTNAFDDAAGTNPAVSSESQKHMFLVNVIGVDL